MEGSPHTASQHTNSATHNLSPKTPSRVKVWRIRLSQLILLCFLGAILTKTLILQTLLSDHFQGLAHEQKNFKNITPIFRGEIVDANNIVLAIDTPKYNVYLRPSLYVQGIPSPEIQEQLISLLKISPEILQNAQNSKYLTKLASNIDKVITAEIQSLNIKGIELESKNHRQYPQGKTAAHIVGFVSGWNATGASGIESTLNKHLKAAHNKSSKVLHRSDGKPIYHHSLFKPVINSTVGQKIQLTIDSKFQYKLDSVIEKYINRFHPEKATAIVMKSKTGEIVGWSHYPNFNPNFYGQHSLDDLNAWSTTQVYEPGSTLKILTVAAALDAKAINKDFQYLDTGYITVNDVVLKNHDHKENYKRDIGITELFQHSSNTATAQIAFMLGKKKFYKYLNKFGFGKQTKIELPAEASGFLPHYKKWDEVDLATSSYGQGMIAVTPIQLISSINSVANDGMYIQPRLIKTILSPDNKSITESFKPETKRVISKQSARQVTQFLADSIAKNHKENHLYIPGRINPYYRVAGKTGTSLKICPKLKTYCPNTTIASFVGYFPAENPLYTILVVFDSPRHKPGWGNNIAGPVFNEIANNLSNLYTVEFENTNQSK